MNLNEITLSNDLKTIEFEINQHRMFASNSIIEIGKRLNHVKENDLAHGQFMDWVENTLDMSYVTANKYMKVAKEFPNISPARTLSLDNLYEISTLPQDPKRQEVKKIEDGNPSSRKEIRDLKKQLKQKDELIENMADSMHDFELHAKELADENERLKSKPAEVVEKPVVPEDYEYLKENNVMLSKELEKAEYEAQTVREAYDTLLKKRQEEDEGSKKYKELTEAIKDMEGQMTRQQKRIQSQKQVYELVDQSKDLLQAITPIPYLINAEFVNENPVAKRELENIATQTEKFLEHLNNTLKKPVIIEGEFIND